MVEHTEGFDNNTQRIGAVKFDSCGGPEIYLSDFETGDCSAWDRVIIDNVGTPDPTCPPT